MKKLCAMMLVLALSLVVLMPLALAAEDIKSYTPFNLTVKEIPVDETHPRGSAVLTFSIKDLPRSTDKQHWEVCIEKKIGDGEWIGTNGIPSETMLDQWQKSPGVFFFEQVWVETYDWDGTKQISYRIYVKLYDETWTGVGASPYSNIVSMGMVSSTWAVAELKKAEELGLLPDILKGADLTKPVNREEFCEIVILLYEKATNTKAEAASPNPFTDTDNPQILKAYKIGITRGTSADKFSPKELITREQCATMLFRAIKEIAPDADYSIAGVKDFPDQKFISGYAAEATKYMSKIGIIKGDSQGNFMPKATTDAQKAAGYGMATREAAIVMSVRSCDKVK